MTSHALYPVKSFSQGFQYTKKSKMFPNADMAKKQENNQEI